MKNNIKEVILISKFETFLLNGLNFLKHFGGGGNLLQKLFEPKKKTKLLQ